MDERELHAIANKDLVVNALGYWPSFHDAHVLSAAGTDVRFGSTYFT